MSASNIKNVTNLRVTDPGINNNYATLSVGNYSSIEYQDGGGSDQYYGVKANPIQCGGDSVFYNADQDSFNVRIEPDDGAGNTVVKVDDFRGSAVVTDTLYNIETIRFYSETGGSGIELVPTFEDYNNFETGNDSFRGTVFDDVIVADAGRNYVQGQAGNDNLIGNVDGDHFNPGAGHDFINGCSNFNQWRSLAI